MVNAMKKIIFPLIFLLTILILAPLARAGLEAKVDRNQLALDETLNLTLTKEGGSAFSSADLAPLEKDFRILGRSQSSSTQISNGSMTSSFSLNLTLAPKRTGILQIPPLTVGGDNSRPLTVKVVTMAQPKTRADNVPIFLESEVDPKVVSVQQQAILTLRIYWAVEAKINEPEMPQLPDVLVEKLNDATYSKSVNGRTYQVFERKYALFPQKSGSLPIPPLTVRASVASQGRQSDPFHDFFPDFATNPGREIVLRSNPEQITVKEKAADYPAGAVWLPTGKLTAAVDWSKEPADLQVGESSTVTITLAGQGLLASQLPPVELPDLPGLKVYQGKAEVQNLKNSDGVTGLRRESIALVPTRAGSLELPEIRLPWWNKESGQVEYTVLPARQLVIKGAAGSLAVSTVPPTTDQSRPEGEASAPAPVSAPTTTSTPTPVPGSFMFWAMACALLALGWLGTGYLLLKSRRQLRELTFERDKVAESGSLREREAFKVLAGACLDNDPARARQALLAWAQSRYPDQRLRSGGDLARLCRDTRLPGLLMEIDGKLYGGGDKSVWSGKTLLAAVEQIRKERKPGLKANSALPPLYR